MQQPELVSLREESAFPYQAPFFFLTIKEQWRDLSPHTTQALGKDMRTLGSFDRSLDEMAE